MRFRPSDFLDDEEVLEVTAFAPYPTSSGQIHGDAKDTRIAWMTLSLKRGESWTDTEGVNHARPALFVAEHAQLPVEGDFALIPVPTSKAAPQVRPGADIAHALRAERVLEILTRTHDVSSSSRSSSASRTTFEEHVASLTLDVPGDQLPDRVVLVDDVLTSGTQLAACVHVLRKAGFRGEVYGFTAAYSVNDPSEPRTWHRRFLVRRSPHLKWATRCDKPEHDDRF